MLTVCYSFTQSISQYAIGCLSQSFVGVHPPQLVQDFVHPQQEAMWVSRHVRLKVNPKETQPYTFGALRTWATRATRLRSPVTKKGFLGDFFLMVWEGKSSATCVQRKEAPPCHGCFLFGIPFMFIGSTCLEIHMDPQHGVAQKVRLHLVVAVVRFPAHKGG